MIQTSGFPFNMSQNTNLFHLLPRADPGFHGSGWGGGGAQSPSFLSQKLITYVGNAVFIFEKYST